MYFGYKPSVCVVWSFFLTASVQGACEINTFSVQTDFNLTRYLGRWYEYKWLPQFYIPAEDLFQDYQHVYQLLPNGTIYVNISGRNPVDLSQCFNYGAYLETTATPGKLLYTRKRNATHYITSSYWVVGTDYDGFAVVFGCREENATGQCVQVDSWIWSRTAQMPRDLQMTVKTIVTGLCLNYQDYLYTEQYNSCTKSACEVNGVSVQKDFDLNKYLGRWYEYKWLPQFYIPAEDLFRDYQHVYQLLPNGTIYVNISGRNPVDLSQCFNYGAYLETTATPGKLLYTRKRNATHYITSSYWVVGTDYDGLAVVFGCRQENATGQCIQVDSWIWSRTAQMPHDLQMKVETMVTGLCLNYQDYFYTEQYNSCTKSACEANGVSIQKDFDLNKFMGSWYQRARLQTPTSKALGDVLDTDVQHIYNYESNGTVTAVTRGRRPAGDVSKCYTYMNQILTTETPGKLRYRSWINSTDFSEDDLWVITTDYTAHALTYSCLEINHNGQCTKYDARIWTRAVSTSTTWASLANSLDILCLRLEDFTATKQSTDCIVGSGSTFQQSVLTAATVCTHIIFALCRIL